MNERQEQLRAEAEHADSSYRNWADGLFINPEMFRLYASPKHRWNYREQAAMLLGDLKNKRLFDMGCGMGEEAVYFAALGASVTAMDVAPLGVSLTQRRAKCNGVQVDARVGDVLNNGLPAHSFDLVHGLGVLHHVGLAAGLRETARLLKPGGRGVFLEHMSSPFVERLKRIILGANDPNYSTYEAPLRWPDCVREVAIFQSYTLMPFGPLFRLRNRIRIFGSPTIQKIDYWTLRALPWLRCLAGGVIISVDS